MYEAAKRHDVRLLLAAGVPQERIAELTGVSVRTIQRIGREPAGPAAPAGARGLADLVDTDENRLQGPAG